MKWLKRRGEDKEHLGWKPQKRYRTSAKWWLINLDSQIRTSLPLPGLKAFQRKEGHKDWAPKRWQHWKHLTICADQGSDGLSAVSFLRSLGVSMTFISDWSHGAQNDFYDTLKDLSLWNFWVMMLVVMNVEHGPWADDVRWNQILDAWTEATHVQVVFAFLQAEGLPSCVFCWFV